MVQFYARLQGLPITQQNFMVHLRMLFPVAVLLASTLLLSPSLAHTSSTDEAQPSMKIEYAIDPGANLDPAAMQEKPFTPAGKNPLNFRFTDASVWLHIHVRRASEDNKPYLLTIGAPYVSRAELFSVDRGKILHMGLTGRHVPSRDSAYPSRLPAFLIPFDGNGNAHLLLRLNTRDLMLLPIEVIPELDFKDQEALALLVHALYLGMALAMVLYNLFLFTGLRDRTYLYYTLFGTSVSLLVIADGGYLKLYVGDIVGPLLPRAIPLLIAAAGGWGLLFARAFLDVKTWVPLYSKLFLILASFFAGTFIYTIFAPSPSAEPGVILTPFIVILSLGVAIHALLRGRQTARLFLLAFSVFLVALGVFVLLCFDIIPATWFTMHSYKMGSAAEMILLSLALADRINVLREEKEEVRRQALSMLEQSRDELEARVVARTAELSGANQTLKRALQENRVLLREVHHRVKNNMQVMLSLLSIRSDGQQGSTDRILADARDRIKAIAMVHTRFCESDDLGQIDFAVFARAMAGDLARSFGHEPDRIQFALSPVALDLDRSVTCGLILNELLTNALKHNDAGRPSDPVVCLSMHNSANVITVSVKDWGSGLPESFDMATLRTLGLTLVKDLTEKKLHGRFSITDLPGKKGVLASVTFPAASFHSATGSKDLADDQRGAIQ